MPPFDVPDDVNTVLDRLEEAFGREPLSDLLTSFSAQLDEAVAALDRGEARSIAHRVAGAAGTLGFAATGRSWLAVSEGVATASAQARSDALHAMAIIAGRSDV